MRITLAAIYETVIAGVQEDAGKRSILNLEPVATRLEEFTKAAFTASAPSKLQVRTDLGNLAIQSKRGMPFQRAMDEAGKIADSLFTHVQATKLEAGLI